MNNIINGEKIAESIKDGIVKEILSLGGKRPNLAIILVGQREDSLLYVATQEKEARKVGIDTHIYKCDADIDEAEVFSMIDCLNKDEDIDAILLQLPLPAGYDTDGLILAIDPAKDVDRFHPENLKPILTNCLSGLLPPLFSVVLEILGRIDCNLEEKEALILSNSVIFGKGLSKVLACRGAKALTMKPDDKNLKKKMKAADIIVSVLGRPNYIKADMIKAGVILIDVGITRDQGSIKGDMDFDDVKGKCSFITPVPGGVGPITTAFLFRNTLELFKQKRK